MLWWNAAIIDLVAKISHVMRPMPTVPCSVPHTSATNVFEAVIMPLNSPSRNLRPNGNHESAV